MLGKTHTLGGSALALGSFLVLQEAGLLNIDLDAPAKLLCILPYSIWGATAPDLDREDMDVAMASPINLAIQKAFKLIGAGHRSAKSHVYPAILILLLTVVSLFGVNIFSVQYVNSLAVYCAVLIGISAGLLSHLLLDMCTKDGIKYKGKRYAFVPELDAFKTGSVYEKTFRHILYIINVLLFILLFSLEIV